MDLAFSLGGPPFLHFKEVLPLDLRRPLRPLQPAFGVVGVPVDSLVRFVLVAGDEAFTDELTLRVLSEASAVADSTSCDVVT